MTELRYMAPDGTPLPGVTDVLDCIGWESRDLINAAAKMPRVQWELACEDGRKAGTLVHGLVAAVFEMAQGKTPAPSLFEVPPTVRARVMNGFLSAVQWGASHLECAPLMVEQPVLRPEDGYAGTPDLLARIDGRVTLVDFKQARVMSPLYVVQGWAYKARLIEDVLNQVVDQVMLVQLGRTKIEWQEYVLPPESEHPALEAFDAALALYRLEPAMRGALDRSNR